MNNMTRIAGSALALTVLLTGGALVTHRVSEEITSVAKSSEDSPVEEIDDLPAKITGSPSEDTHLDQGALVRTTCNMVPGPPASSSFDTDLLNGAQPVASIEVGQKLYMAEKEESCLLTILLQQECHMDAHDHFIRSKGTKLAVESANDCLNRHVTRPHCIGFPQLDAPNANGYLDPPSLAVSGADCKIYLPLCLKASPTTGDEVRLS